MGFRARSYALSLGLLLAQPLAAASVHASVYSCLIDRLNRLKDGITLPARTEALTQEYLARLAPESGSGITPRALLDEITQSHLSRLDDGTALEASLAQLQQERTAAAIAIAQQAGKSVSYEIALPSGGTIRKLAKSDAIQDWSPDQPLTLSQLDEFSGLLSRSFSNGRTTEPTRFVRRVALAEGRGQLSKLNFKKMLVEVADGDQDALKVLERLAQSTKPQRLRGYYNWIKTRAQATFLFLRGRYASVRPVPDEKLRAWSQALESEGGADQVAREMMAHFRVSATAEFALEVPMTIALVASLTATVVESTTTLLYAAGWIESQDPTIRRLKADPPVEDPRLQQLLRPQLDGIADADLRAKAQKRLAIELQIEFEGYRVANQLPEKLADWPDKHKKAFEKHMYGDPANPGDGMADVLRNEAESDPQRFLKEHSSN